MKLVALTSAALLAATTAFAGNLTYEAPADTPVVVEEVTTGGGGSLGGSAAWIIPLVAVAAIAYALSQDQNN